MPDRYTSPGYSSYVHGILVTVCVLFHQFTVQCTYWYYATAHSVKPRQLPRRSTFCPSFPARPAMAANEKGT